MMHHLKTIETLDVNSQPLRISRDGDMIEAVFGSSKGPDPGPSSEDLLHVSRLVTIGELAACFAHEVFNPLMLIRGHLRFADQNMAADDPARVNLETISRAERRIEEMAKRMLDFSKKRPVQREQRDVAEIVSDALRFIQPYFMDQFVDVKISVVAGLPPVVVDHWQIVQALVNILQNAADATRLCDRRVITIAVDRAGDDIGISVSDSGPGISLGDLPHIFSPFFTTKGERGTGLGLYIAKRVIEEHRGTITVQSSSRGATFTMSIPLHAHP